MKAICTISANVQGINARKDPTPVNNNAPEIINNTPRIVATKENCFLYPKYPSPKNEYIKPKELILIM